MVEQFYWHVWQPYLNKWRREHLRLPPLPSSGPFREERWQKQPLLYGISPSVVTKPDDWPETAHLTGYWFLPEDTSWKPDEKLRAFVDSGPAPVYIGFGSMPEDEPEKLKAIALEALRLSGQRAVVQGNWLGETSLPDNMLHIGWAPHSWLFPRCTAAVHHGGAGTLAYSLRAGIPVIVVPYAWDQFFWGRMVVKLGVGTKPLSRKELSAEELARAIMAATDDCSLRYNAEKLGRCIKGEDGTTAAIEIINHQLCNSFSTKS
jgi:UDP:flavonoid glycosyltransferase YjiC (YdhE family)